MSNKLKLKTYGYDLVFDTENKCDFINNLILQQFQNNGVESIITTIRKKKDSKWIFNPSLASNNKTLRDSDNINSYNIQEYTEKEYFIKYYKNFQKEGGEILFIIDNKNEKHSTIEKNIPNCKIVELASITNYIKRDEKLFKWERDSILDNGKNFTTVILVSWHSYFVGLIGIVFKSDLDFENVKSIIEKINNFKILYKQNIINNFLSNTLENFKDKNLYDVLEILLNMKPVENNDLTDEIKSYFTNNDSLVLYPIYKKENSVILYLKHNVNEEKYYKIDINPKIEDVIFDTLLKIHDIWRIKQYGK